MAHRRTSPKIFLRARELRKDPGPAEAKLWASLRLLRQDGVHFRRQHAIGRYIADFCAPRKKLIIEVDGSQHLLQKEYDATRTAFLESKGYRVLRFWNWEVMNEMPVVMATIRHVLEEKSKAKGG